MMTTHLTNLIRKFIPQQTSLTIEDVYPCLIGQRERNHARMEQIIKDMGTKWILHPSHTKKRLKTKRPV